MLAILDYGMANLRSVQKAFEGLGHAARIITTPEEIQRTDHLVVPGVGAFRDAADVLFKTGAADAIREHVHAGRPLLGICLGLQLLFDVGHEDGTHAGLAILPGECVRFAVDAPPHQLKVPHMGWNSLAWTRDVPLFRGLQQGAYVYFVHSYHVVPKDLAIVAATAHYGEPFVAAVWKDNVTAVQFHPEKSQEVGATILKNFAEWRP